MYQVMIANEKKSECQQIVQVLKQAAHPVEMLPCVSDTASFVKMLAGNTPDLIITDVELPGNPGFDTVEYIRYKKCPAKILVITDHTEFEVLQKAVRLGVSDYLRKPIDARELQDSVDKVIKALNKEEELKKVKERGSMQQQKFFQTAEKEFMMSLLLEQPDLPMLHEICAEENEIFYMMIADGQVRRSEAGGKKTREIMRNEIFKKETCLILLLANRLYLLIGCKEMPDQEEEWLCDRAKEIVSKLERSCAMVRVGVSTHMRSPQEFHRGLGEAREAVEQMNTSGISLYRTQPFVISQREKSYVEHAVDYMECHYGENLTLSRVAENIGITAFYLSRIMSKVKNHTFSEELTQIRMRHATEMLREGEKSVREISNLCGYRNVNYFYKIIKKQSGTTAKNLRQSMLYEKRKEDGERNTTD